MGYVTKRVTVTRQETHDEGATCDRCGKALIRTPIGRKPMFCSELSIYPDISLIHPGATVPRLLFCTACFEQVLEAVPEIKAAIDRANAAMMAG